MICSAQRIESAMALTVAGSRFPPSNGASFLTAGTADGRIPFSTDILISIF
jgi:hypothetical protein